MTMDYYLTCRLDRECAEAVKRMMVRCNNNRSEALRRLIRAGAQVLEQEQEHEHDRTECR